MSEPSGSRASVSTRFERAAARLVRHAEWSKGFWLSYVFTVSSSQAHALQRRLEAALAAQGRTQRVLRPATPEALEGVLDEVLSGGGEGCSWVEAVRGGRGAMSNPVWSVAWQRLMLRANERRELIRDEVEGGLVFVAHPELKDTIRRAAPDLWSIRALALDVPAQPAATLEVIEDLGFLIQVSNEIERVGGVDAELLERELEELEHGSSGRFADEGARVRVRLAIRLLGARRYEDAAEQLRLAIQTHRAWVQERPETHLAGLGNALLALGTVASVRGAHDEALEASEEAVEIWRGLARDGTEASRSGLARALDRLCAQLAVLGRREEALVASQEAVAIWRELVEEHRDGSVSSLAWSLTTLGIRMEAVGRLEFALWAAVEAVDIWRESSRQHPGAFMPNLAVSLASYAMMLGRVGQHAEALEGITESLHILLPLHGRRSSPFDAIIERVAREAAGAARAAGHALPEDLAEALGLRFLS